MALVTAAMSIMTENKLPACSSVSENVWRISGKAMPNVATIMDGIKFEQGTMAAERRSRLSDDGCGSMNVSYFNGMKT